MLQGSYLAATATGVPVKKTRIVRTAEVTVETEETKVFRSGVVAPPFSYSAREIGNPSDVGKGRTDKRRGDRKKRAYRPNKTGIVGQSF